MLRHKLCLIVLLTALPLSTASAAPDIEPIDDEDTTAWDHFEFSMGFLAGQRSYSQTNFTQRDDAPALNLDQSFGRFPYRRVTTLGLRYDARLVVSYVRMTAGFDLPFATYEARDSTHRYAVDGQERDVTARSLGIRGLRFGIGGEIPFSPVTPFVDLLGTVNFLKTSLEVDDVTRDYGATTFGFSARGGLRLQVRRWFFVSAAGEVGISGDVLWGAELAVGFSTT